MHSRLTKPLIHFTFFKNISVSFVAPLTITRNTTLHERATDHIWFIETWKNQWDFILDLMKLLHFVLFAQNINCGSNSLAFFYS